jgi:spore coat protein U-like protein
MNKYFKVALAVGALTAAGGASAATTTGNLTVSATVASNCLINSAAMPFGTYVPGTGTDLDVSGSIVVRCTNGMPYAIGLGGGLAGTEANRNMQNGAALLSYQLFKDAGRSLNWGQTVVGERLGGLFGAGMGTTQTHTIYGRIPDSGANLLVAAGGFGDTVLVTITY